MSETVQFYFDYISPNAYLAWTQLPRLTQGRNIEVEPVPVLFAALLDAHGQRGPAEIPAKMQWMVRNILRKAKQLEVPLNPPPSHPFNPLLALRISSLSLARDEKSALITAIFEGVWARRIDVNDPLALSAIIDEIGLDGDGMVTRAESPETKSLLREQTSAAINAGVFGVPTIMVGENLFWGLDDFKYLDAFLNGEDLLDRERVEAWAKVRPSAYRGKTARWRRRPG
jgi:2-hydroxychromene-2-carboxylate isomerase